MAGILPPNVVAQAARPTPGTPLHPEPQALLDPVLAIAREAGAVVRVLDPVASGDQPNADAYEIVMKKNLDVLKEALALARSGVAGGESADAGT